ncbi:MAG: hypothetical protein V7L05_13595 [Nostoc sp.]
MRSYTYVPQKPSLDIYLKDLPALFDFRRTYVDMATRSRLVMNKI